MRTNIAKASIGFRRNSTIQIIFKKGAYRCTILFLYLISSSLAPIHAAPKEYVVSLTDENRILSTAIELHITSPDAPFFNSTVSLNHEDAWLFFDNIKPSYVVDSFASNILINGVSLVNGVNGRVAIYAQGTVIMPHGSSFKPLTVFSEEEFGGTSQQMILHTYYNNLGELNNAIKSFKLKRGYMATFANNADGSGYSRVFIADTKDLEISIMPDELYGTVSFIRVFKHQWVSKKGWVAWSANEDQWAKSTADIEMTNSTWNYSWNDYPRTTANSEAVPQRPKLTYPGWGGINAKENVSHLLSYNEPSHPEQHKDDNGGKAMTVDQALAQMPDHLRSGLRIGSPSTTSNSWLFDFIDRCDELNYRVDFVAIHAYWAKSPQQWYNDLKYVYERTGRPIWITEWNNGANWTKEWWPDDTQDLTPANAQKQLNDLTAILQVLDTAHFVERYSIYNWVQDRRAIILADTLTPAGEYYAANKSQIAYNSVNEVIPQWNFDAPELTYRYLSLSNSIRLSWINNNGEICRGYKIDKKVNNGNYETIYTGDDVSVLYYVDPVDPEIAGSISYKVSLLNLADEYVASNTVSCFQTFGSDTIQFGRFMLSNSDWNTALFSEEFQQNPITILGIPTYNIAFPITQRANNISTSLFKFHIAPWAYLNNPDITKTDSLSVMIIPEGFYDFEGLQTEAKSISEISGNWTSVAFDSAFNVEPAIFCNITSNNTEIPLTVAVRNVTSSGFELRLKAEENNSKFIFPETIHYLAIEPGNGWIGDKRIIVGKTDSISGVSSVPIEVEFDSTFSKPAIFAGLLTAADNFASTLRYSFSGDHKIKFAKQREMSGSLTTTKTDQLGWMIIDLADGQEHISSMKKLLQQRILCYPNPVKDVIYFEFSEPTLVKIFDISGRKCMDINVLNYLDVSNLPTGHYTLTTDGNLPVSFIKID
jgi:hypothetical protein